MITAMAACSAALAVMLVAGGRPDLLAARLGRSERRTSAETAKFIAGLPRGVQVLAAALAGAAAGSVVAGLGGLLAGALAVPAGLIGLVRHLSRRTRRRREGDVEEACLALAGELGSGVPPRQALFVVAREWPELFAAASGRVAIGGDPAATLRESAQQPGAEALTAVAAAWEVSERTGAGLASVLVAVAESLRAEAAVRREADSQLASVRATSRLMALLPLATLVLFSAGDGEALTFLTRTSYGLICLASAAVFIAAGLFWVDRTARSVRSVWQR